MRRCEHCGQEISEPVPYPEKVFMFVRKMRTGHGGRLSEGQERYFDSLGPVFTDKKKAFEAFSNAYYAVYECTKIGVTSGK